MPWWMGLKVPTAIAALGLVLAVLMYPHIALALPGFAFAAMWMLATARYRRAYRKELLRARAAADEREYRQSIS